MASPARAQENLTLEEFLRLPEEEPPLEYIDGRIEAEHRERRGGWDSHGISLVGANRKQPCQTERKFFRRDCAREAGLTTASAHSTLMPL